MSPPGRCAMEHCRQIMHQIVKCIVEFKFSNENGALFVSFLDSHELFFMFPRNIY